MYVKYNSSIGQSPLNTLSASEDEIRLTNTFSIKAPNFRQYNINVILIGIENFLRWETKMILLLKSLMNGTKLLTSQETRTMLCLQFRTV